MKSSTEFYANRLPAAASEPNFSGTEPIGRLPDACATPVGRVSQIMKLAMKAVAASMSAATLFGCASGGGGSGPSISSQPTPDRSRSSGGGCGLYAIFDIWGACAPSYEEQLEEKFIELGLSPRYTPPFTTWSALPPVPGGHYNTEVEYQFDTLDSTVSYTQSSPRANAYTYEGCSHHVRWGPMCNTYTVAATEATIDSTAHWPTNVLDHRKYGPEYDANRNLHTIFSFSQFDPLAVFGNLAAVGQPGIDFVHRKYSDSEITDSRSRAGSAPSLTAFAEADAHELALVANPYKLDWSYQSFGVWNHDASRIGLSSFGAATPASAVPSVGQANFTGKLAGLHVSPAGQGSMATAEVSVRANFSDRSLTFSSTGTTLTRDARSATAAPNLNLSGTLVYSPSANTFTGTLANAGGTLSGSTTGRYYGPAAQELGGVFSLKSPTTVETFAGAYGAKR